MKRIFAITIVFLLVYVQANALCGHSILRASAENNFIPVPIAPYDTIFGPVGNWGDSTADVREFITVGQKYRIRQTTNVYKISFFVALKEAGLTGFYVKFWRKNGSAYDLVGQTENLVAHLAQHQTVSITLSTPIPVQEGDYYGYRIENTSTGEMVAARTGIAGVTTYTVDETSPSTTNYDWEAQTAGTGVVFPIVIYGRPPQFVFIGDSIIAGHPAHYSFLESTATTNISSTISKYLSALGGGYTYQNMGIGSQTTTSIAYRFTADVLNLRPTTIVMDGGVNDIAVGVPKDTFIAKWTEMLSAAQSNVIVKRIIVIKILPWTNGTDEQMRIRDDWNSSLATLAGNYSKAIVVDTSSYVGQTRAGGDEGNLWNIKTEYGVDGVHFNSAGHAQIAQAIIDAL